MRNGKRCRPGLPTERWKRSSRRVSKPSQARDLSRARHPSYVQPFANPETALDVPAPNQSLGKCATILRHYFGSEFLSGVEYRVGIDGDLSLQTVVLPFGTTAITSDHVIVFRSRTSAESPWTWAHELGHVKQVERSGLAAFCEDYLRNFLAVEEEAGQGRRQRGGPTSDGRGGPIGSCGPSGVEPVPAGRLATRGCSKRGYAAIPLSGPELG